MARYNEILAGRYNRFAQKLFGTKGGPPAPQLAGDMQVSMPLFSGAEHRYLESWYRYGAQFSQSAGAGVISTGRLRNPAGSNVVFVLEKILLAETVADAALLVRLGATNADFSLVLTNANIARFDNRGQQQPTAVISLQTAGITIGAPIYRGNVAANQQIDVIVTDIQEFPLLPGDAIDIATTTVNSALQASFWWRERFLEEPERI